MLKKRNKACASGKKNQAGTKKLKVMDTVLEKPEEEMIQVSQLKVKILWSFKLQNIKIM